MAYGVAYSARAVRALRRLQPKIAANIMDRIAVIAVDPFADHQNVERLQGDTDSFRLRVGNLRVPYSLDRDAQTLKVAAVAPRGQVYKRR